MATIGARTARVVALCVSFLHAGCAVQRPVVPMQPTKLDYDELKPYTEPGENSIKGQGFLRQQGGRIVTCAGNRVTMIPATSFYREWVMLVRAGKDPQMIEKFGPAYSSVIKQSQCDAQGNFSFAKLPNGAWFVTTSVHWTVALVAQDGGMLMREVTLSNNGAIQVLLTEKDFIGR